MSLGLNRKVLTPLGGILAMQSVVTMAAYSVSVVYPLAASDLGIEPESVGFMVSIIYTVAMTTGLTSASLISRFGPTNVFRLLLALSAGGAMLLWFPSPITAVLTAAVFGYASGPLNPTGSHVMARISNAKNRALLFSLKQCGTPLGGMLAGVCLPTLALIYGWQWAMMLIPAGAVLFIVLASFGRLGGAEPRVGTKDGFLKQIANALRVVSRDSAIRNLTLACATLAMSQMALAAFLVVYLWKEIGLAEATAGFAFAVMHVSGISSRILLGLVADRLIPARWVLVWLCVALAISLVCIGNFSPGWSIVAISAANILAGASGNGWVGLYFAELARLSPPDQVSAVAGGSQFFTHLGLVVGPLAFGLLLKLTGSYTVCFNAFAVLALVSAAAYARANVRSPTVTNDS